MKQKTILFLFLLFSSTILFAQSPCVGLQTDSVYPQPDSGKYLPGTTVTFCYTLHSYNSTPDLLNGFELTFGPGWDTTTLTTLSSPTSCDGAGNWTFFDSCVTPHAKFEEGFYYDRSLSGIPGQPGNGIPGDNLGDYDLSDCSWSFCISIKVKDTASNGSLYANVTPLSDLVIGGDTMARCFTPPFPLVPSNTATGVKDINPFNSAINIYPNPSADKLTADLSGLQPVKELTVFNLLGEEIYNSPAYGKTALLNVSSFSNGIYFLVIKSGSNVLQGRFVVQH